MHGSNKHIASTPPAHCGVRRCLASKPCTACVQSQGGTHTAPCCPLAPLSNPLHTCRRCSSMHNHRLTVNRPDGGLRQQDWTQTAGSASRNTSKCLWGEAVMMMCTTVYCLRRQCLCDCCTSVLLLRIHGLFAQAVEAQFACLTLRSQRAMQNSQSDGVAGCFCKPWYFHIQGPENLASSLWNTGLLLGQQVVCS